MRKQDVKDARKRKIIVLLLAGLMVFSVFGAVFYGFSDPYGSVRYKGIAFTRTQNGWMAKIDKQPMSFLNHPLDLEYMNVTQDIVQRIKNPVEIDTTGSLNDPANETIALLQYDLARTLEKQGVYSIAGALESSSYNIPVITCLDATPQKPVILIKTANETMIRLEQDCIILQGPTPYDLAAASERLLYIILGVMDE